MLLPWQKKADTAGESPAENDTKSGAVLKIKFAYKAAAFWASVMTLSWFFEGWRKIHESIGVYSVSILTLGIVCTAALVTLQAFWIYIEEKQKGSLLRRVGLFEKLYEGLVQRQLARTERGEKTKHA
ncbi:MAG TPA: hypothetical protein V6C97_11035 [Oculatellaceae cyanobacterium]